MNLDAHGEGSFEAKQFKEEVEKFETEGSNDVGLLRAAGEWVKKTRDSSLLKRHQENLIKAMESAKFIEASRERIQDICKTPGAERHLRLFVDKAKELKIYGEHPQWGFTKDVEDN